MKGKRKALFLESTVREQALVLADMKLHIVQASAEQLVSQHEMKKMERELSVEKQTVQDQMIAKDLEIKKVRFTFRCMWRCSVTLEVTLLYFVGNRKTHCLEHTLKKQKKCVTDMKLSMVNASKEQVATLQRMKKVVRQFTVDKDDALTQAQKARDALSCSAKKAESRINKLERKVQHLTDAEVQLQGREEERAEVSQHLERRMAKERRQLEIEQAEVMKQQSVLGIQTESLAYQRELTQKARRQIKSTHSKALEHVKVASQKDKEAKTLF